MPKDNQKGFTLVELAIVMIIIGLLIGGVLKGQQLIENAKVTSTVSSMKGFQAAQVIFQDTYSALPGDIRNAAARIPGCEAGNTNDCAGGNGDSIVGRQFTDFDPGGEIPDFNTGGVGSPNQENTQYWKHLALSDLITGVDPSAATDTDTAWGETNPASSVTGGYTIAFWNYVEGPAVVNGHSVFLTRELDGFSGVTRGIGVMTSKAAASVDRKVDNGRPYQGNIWSMNPSSGCIIFDAGGGDFTQRARYNEQVAGKNCALWYFFE